MFKPDDKKGRKFHLDNMITLIEEWKNNCKPFKYEFTCEETEISMKKLMYFKVEDVIKYLSELGITSIHIVE